MSNQSINREKWSVIRFDQMTECLTVRVEPSETTLERYVGLEHLDPETLKISRWGTPSDVIGEKLHFWPGDIIFGKRRAYQKKLAVADFEGICSAHAMVLRARPEIVLPEFLPFFMQSDMFFERALSISVGSLSPTINWGTLAKQEFPLPPLDEQRRIAEILWATDVTIQGFVAVLNGLSGLQDGYRETIFFKSGSEPKPIKDLASIRYGLGQPPSLKENGVRMIRATDISKGEINENGIIRVDLDEVPNGRAILLEEGDIIIVRSGAYTGDSAMITREFVGCIAGYDLVIHPNPRKITPFFLADFLLHKRTVEKILKPLSIRSAQPHLNVNDVGNIEIPIPSLENQDVFTCELSNIHKQIISTKKHLSILRNQFTLLREGLLKNQGNEHVH